MSLYGHPMSARRMPTKPITPGFVGIFRLSLFLYTERTLPLTTGAGRSSGPSRILAKGLWVLFRLPVSEKSSVRDILIEVEESFMRGLFSGVLDSNELLLFLGFTNSVSMPEKSPLPSFGRIMPSRSPPNQTEQIR